MGLFKRKSDPISERARALNQEIAALEAQIQQLSAREAQPPAPPKAAPQSSGSAGPPPRVAAHPKISPQPAAQPSSSQPRLRSTAMPHHRQAASVPAPAEAAHAVVFEEVDHERIQSRPELAAPEHSNELDVRKYNLTAFWLRLKVHFRGPPTSNPKLVNYLAAGSIQGLRPMRYERRVARNRFIFFVIGLVIVLWGLIAMFARHK